MRVGGAGAGVAGRLRGWRGVAPRRGVAAGVWAGVANVVGDGGVLDGLLTDGADALAFDRALDGYRCAPFVELRLLDWAHTIARRWLYEVADEIRIAELL